MKKKQINLKNLQVKSFVTDGKFNNAQVKGGSNLCDTNDDPFFCGGYGGGGGGGSNVASCNCPTLDQSCQGNCSNLAGTCSCQCTAGCIQPSASPCHVGDPIE